MEGMGRAPPGDTLVPSPLLQAAEADGAAFRLAMQRYSEQAGSKELLQDMVGVEGLLVHGLWGCRA